MTIKQLSISEFEEIYKLYMVNDFPPAELKPLERITHTMSTGLCHSLCIYDNDILCGYAVFIIPENSQCMLLDYFAILKDFRGTGMGHKFFSRLRAFFNCCFPALKGMYIECEAPHTSSSPEETKLRMRRIDFYKDNGCLKTLLGSRVFGVEYSILYFPLYDDAADYTIINRKNLDFIYKKMFKKHHYQNEVRLWDRLGKDTLSMSAKKLAPLLLGKLLCRSFDGKIVKYRITETECYCGEADTACHAAKGKTDRTKVLYEKGGTSYVYLCYGMHNLFNVVSGIEGQPEAVLIRGVEGFDGPGKLTKAMNIDRSLNGEDMTVSDNLWLEDDGTKVKYRRGKRVGIDYATPKYRDILWRFISI